MADLTNWQFHSMHVETNQVQTRAIAADSTLLAGGPPFLSNLGALDARPKLLSEAGIQLDEQLGTSTRTEEMNTSSDILMPMGLTEQFTLTQNKQTQRIFEIGSSRSYIIPGRTIQALNLGRIFFNGPSLLRILYGVYQDVGGSFSGSVESYTIEVDLQLKAGYGQFLINLGSDLFNYPFGLGVFLRDQSGRWYGAYYCEYAFVNGYSMSISSGSILLVEGATAQFDTIRPIDITGVGTLRSSFGLASPPAFRVGG